MFWILRDLNDFNENFILIMLLFLIEKFVCFLMFFVGLDEDDVVNLKCFINLFFLRYFLIYYNLVFFDYLFLMFYKYFIICL